MEEQEEEKKNQEKGVKTFFIIIVTLFVIGILFFIFRPQINILVNKIQGNIFDYNGLEFAKHKFGTNTLYSTQLTLMGRQGEFIYTLDLNNDPRELENISFAMTRGLLAKNYVSFNKAALQCNNSALVAWNLGSFLGTFGSEVHAAVADNETLEYIKEQGSDIYPIANCGDALNQNVILVLAGQNETKVYAQFNCIMIEAKDCEILESSERFMLGIVELLFLGE